MSTLPLDIILEVAWELNLADSVHLLTTCSTFRSLLSSRNFWIQALYRIKDVHKQPLPCSAAVDISTLSLATLQVMAQRAHRLDRTWSQELIRPVSVRTLPVGRDIIGIHAIYGTDLILTVTSGRRVSCFDTHSGECLASIDFPGNTWIRDRDFTVGPCPVELPGQCLLAFGSTDSINGSVELCALRLDFRNREHVTLDKEFSKRWNSPRSFFRNVTIDEHVIGGVLDDLVGASLVYCRFQEDILHTKYLCSSHGSGKPSCVLHRGSLFVTRLDFDGRAEILRFGSGDSCPSPASGAPGIADMDGASAYIPRGRPELESDLSLSDCHTRIPTYGVLNVTVRGAAVQNVLRECVHFGPSISSPRALRSTSILAKSPGSSWALRGEASSYGISRARRLWSDTSLTLRRTPPRIDWLYLSPA
ncbi:hypothetical protein FB451DRAFT_1239061 [Mycena latifolia]|nr:hypothetical protein FB451DRAFT_1239061 [Mycena latifolia]